MCTFFFHKFTRPRTPRYPYTGDVRVSFEAPLTDGGSAVQSYTVEWDTDPGVQEVQTITTATFTNANEMQTITTTALDQDEVQLVTTNATGKEGPRLLHALPPAAAVAVAVAATSAAETYASKSHLHLPGPPGRPP